MGQSKLHNEQIAPSKVLPEVYDQYDRALSTLASRCLAEPYNMHAVDARINPEMLNGNIASLVIAECQKQFRDTRKYSPATVAAGIQVRPESLYAMAQNDNEVDLPFAFDAFNAIFGRMTELQIAEFTAGWVMRGMNSEEIRIEADKIRKKRGLLAKGVGTDGRAEFENELLASIDGKVVEYPIKPPLQSMREFVPYHEPGDYIIIGARTGMGKSYIAMNYVYYAALSGIPSAYINLENTPKNIQKRLWQMHSGLAWSRDLSGLSDNDTRRAVVAWEEVKKMPVRSHDTGRDLHNILNTIRSDYYERGIALAVVDYIQLMKDRTTGGNRVDVLAEISAELRALAKELNIVIVGMAQINRTGTDAGDNRPQLTGLRGSGDLEQDATSVLLLYRPEYYQITEDSDGIPYPPEYADIHWAKGRESGTGFVKCRFNHIRGFYDADPTPVFSTAPDYQNAQPFTMPRQETPDGIPF